MPTYQYRCSICGYEFEDFHSIKEDPEHICKHKESKKHSDEDPAKMERVIFGGAGWGFDLFKD